MYLHHSAGNTPLIYLESLSSMMGNGIYLKYEACNPFGSSMDRVAEAAIATGFKSGRLQKKGCIVEASQGNLAISLAHYCLIHGIMLYIAMPENSRKELMSMLRLLQVQVVCTPAAGGMSEARERALFMSKDIWTSFYPDQFGGDIAVQAHYGTGTEIAVQCKEKAITPDLFVSGVGSGATITGAGRKLREFFPDIALLAVEPEEAPVLSGGTFSPHGLCGIGVGFVPEAFDRAAISQVQAVSSGDAARACQKILVREGIPCGLTTGANLHAALRFAVANRWKDKNIVIMGHDGLERSIHNRL